MNMQAMLKQAQALQKDMMKIKNEIDETEFVGESSMVKVTMKGTREAVKVEIDFEDSLDKDDIEMLQDSLVLAINDANKKIDKINILEASRLGMNTAVDNLKVKPDFIITDAMDLRRENSLGIIKGDAKSITIAAASVLAKVTRDHIMDEYDKIYPQYEYKKHKGYPTKRHLELLEKYGILDIYRTTYGPVKKIMEENNE